VVLPLAAAFLVLLVNRDLGARIISLVAGALLVALAWSWFRADLPSPVAVIVAGIPAPEGIQLSIDRLSAVLAMLIASSGFLVILYSQSYLKARGSQSKYYAVYLALMAATFGILLTRDLFNLFVFYEILCISSYILVSFEQTKASLEASIKYLILGSVGSIFMLIAIGLAYRVSGSLAMGDIASSLALAKPSYAIFTAALFVFGMGIEAAIFPLNTWLPDAHSSAPSSISAVLSGFVIELALVVLLRVSMSVFAGVHLLSLLRFLALVGIVVGELAAFGQSELKRTLAYSSIGQIGLMLFAISLGTKAGLQAGIGQLVMHAGAKSVLFLIAGYFILRTRGKTLSDYRGLARKMPLSGVFFTLAVLSLIGVPPLFGFFTKYRILSAAAESGAWVGVGVILFATVIEAAYFFRIIRTLYGRPATTEAGVSAPEEYAAAAVSGPGSGVPGAAVSYTHVAAAPTRAACTEMDPPAMLAVFGFSLLVVFGWFLLPLIGVGSALL
jgi:proton-translocating NADH-quinone oxidoreductase chain N